VNYDKDKYKSKKQWEDKTIKINLEGMIKFYRMRKLKNKMVVKDKKRRIIIMLERIRYMSRSERIRNRSS